MVDIQDLSFGYSKKKTLFNRLHLELKSGNVYGLLGKNGAGKTTLLKIISGLVFENEGRCRVHGHDSKDRVPAGLEDICFIPEEYYMPSVRIDRYVMLHAPFYKRFDHSKLSWLLKEFQLEPHHKLHQLSFGQRKKFLLAFGLATCARLLLMDEPTNGLDIPSKSQFRRVIAASVNEDQCVVISTHQVRDLQNLIDPIIIIDEGKIIFNQDIAQIASVLYFDTVLDIKENMQPLYHEEGIGGYAVITPNFQGKDSRMDIELLFNGVTSNTKNFDNEFKK